MNLSLALLGFITGFVLVAQNESTFYKLINGEYENRQSQRRLAHKEFHACSIDENCTDVVKYKASGKYARIYGKGEAEKVQKGDLIWKKIDIVEGKESDELSFEAP